MTKNEETRMEIARRFTKYAERFDDEFRRYRAAVDAGNSARADGRNRNLAECRKRVSEVGGHAFVAAQGCLYQLRAMASYFRLSIDTAISEMQLGCEAAFSAHLEDIVPDVRKTAVLASNFNRKWLEKLQATRNSRDMAEAAG